MAFFLDIPKRSWRDRLTDADWIDSRALPLLAAFVAGALVGLLSTEAAEQKSASAKRYSQPRCAAEVTQHTLPHVPGLPAIPTHTTPR